VKKILVTGASGFIGSRIYNKFINEGYEVCGWSRDKNTDYVQVNLLNKQVIRSALLSFRPDIVIHCAGSADVGKSVQNPDKDYEGNVTVTHNLLFGLHEVNLDNVKVVFMSSAGVYGNPMSLPITENMPLNPLSPYAVHKVMCEELCKYFILNYNMDIKIARIFSAYGKGLKKQIFWDMYNKAKLTGRLDMFGTGSESRDYIHVEDVIQSIFLLATTESKENIFNVANGEELTIWQVTQWFAEYVGIGNKKICFNGTVREGDPLNWRADISRIKKLGYKKTVDIKCGLQEYITWAMNI